MRLISVVMGSPNEKAREDASAALLNYGYTFFETVRVEAAHATVLKPRVYRSASEFAAVGVPDDVYATVARGQATTLSTQARLSHEPLIAPLAAGQQRRRAHRGGWHGSGDCARAAGDARRRCRPAASGRAPSTPSRCGSSEPRRARL